MRILLLLPPLLALPLLLGPPAAALVIEDGSPNDSRPADDPGWDNVGRIQSSLNAVYLGNGWAATARHVDLGSQTAVFDGVDYPIVPGSDVVIEHDTSHDADLKVFRMLPYPRHLPDLPIASVAASGDPAMLIAKGRANGGAVGDPVTGYAWGGSGIKRWGTNELGGTVGGSPYVSVNVDSGADRTRSLVTQFDAGGSSYEAAIAGADSGGALFVRHGPDWKLAGICWATLGAVAQVSSYGDDGLSADLTYAPYRDQLLAIVRPCDDGVDNDGDGLTDANDPGCLGPGDLSEEPACSDGLDNDADGAVDTLDADCVDAGDGLEAPDADGDEVADFEDNCLDVPNPEQRDSNLDGFGNRCDADYDDDGVVGIPDFQQLAAAYGSLQGQPQYDPAVDTDGDGAVGLSDYSFFGSAWGGTPGPSGLDCAGTPPCL